jgi:GntR family transcriptional repressor for pyruvate dehydrogenase complex
MKTRRLYREVANQLAAQIANGTFRPGDRLPAERDLAVSFSVSRPTIREAMIALEIAGQIEIRTGAGIFVLADHAAQRENPVDDIGPGPFELIEARAALEGEAAALAAVRISESELAELDHLCRDMAEAAAHGDDAEAANQRFHQIVGEATRNSTIEAAINYMWTLRVRMPMWGKLHQVISDIEGKSSRDGQQGISKNEQSVLDHRRILYALRARDPDGARKAMRTHLEHVRSDLLKASELDAIDVSPPHKAGKH